MKINFLCLVLLLAFLSLPELSYSVGKCNPEDREVLLKIKASFNNNIYFWSWVPGTDCCKWYKVFCDPTINRVISLYIFNTNISGQIPEVIGDLPYLDSIFFHKFSNLTGAIPRVISRLTRLRRLTISWTNISGPIPSFIGELKNLTYLNLSFNNLTGSIPPSLAQLVYLNFLRLDRNRLTGSIPDSFAGLIPMLLDVDLSHNQLSGKVPRAWGALNFSMIQLQTNRLEGDISFLFEKNKTIEEADFSRNMLQFDISNIEFPDRLSHLDLNHNMITGVLPNSMINLEYLMYINVSYNRLCGRIPFGGRLQEHDYYTTAYFHNRCLCGAPLPNSCK